MTTVRLLSGGFTRATRHLRLAVVLYLPSAIAALVAAAVAKGILGPPLDASTFAENVLHGGWFPVWVDFTASRPGALDGLVGPLLALLLVGVAVLQVAVAAGVVGTLVEQENRRPFVLGVRQNVVRYLRAALVYLTGLVPIAIVAGATARGFFKLAETRQDGRFDLVGIATAGLVAFLLWAPWRLAYDLARVSAARHDRGSMLLGMLRALGDVLRRPIVLLPLAAVAVVAPLVLHIVYGWLRSPWSPSTGLQIAMLVVAQQLVMLVRSAIRLWVWGSVVEADVHLGTRDWCRPLGRRRARTESEPVAQPVVSTAADPQEETSAVARASALSPGSGRPRSPGSGRR